MPNLRNTPTAKLEDLKAAVEAFAVALADGPGRWGRSKPSAAQLTQHRLTAGTLLDTYSESPRTQG
ncbi:MAG: hypothetical protein JWR83_4 [Aeromicrobium sp.]|nr:hypothetical protein [Aeromicrobium sp.]